MDLEGDDVLAGDGAHRGENDVELGEDGGVVCRDSGGHFVEVLVEVEARHETSVEVGDDAAHVLHAHVEHVVVVDGGDGDFATQIGGDRHVVAEVGGLLGGPGGVVEVDVLPVGGHFVTAVVELPVVVVDLEGEERGEQGGHRRHQVAQLAHLEDHRAHVDGEVPARGVLPAVVAGVEELERIDAVLHAEVAVVQGALGSEGGDGGDDLSVLALAGVELVGGLFGPRICHGDQRDERADARAVLHSDGDDGGGFAAAEALGVDGVLRGGRELGGSAGELAGVGVDGDADGQRGRDGEVVVVVGVGVDLSHLDVLVDEDRGLEGEIGDGDKRGVDVEVQGTQQPGARGGVAGGEVLEAVLVVGLAVVHPHLLVLALERPLHAGDGLQRGPLLRVAVARLQRELSGEHARLAVGEVDADGGDPLAAVVVEGDRPVVVVADRRLHRVAVVLGGDADGVALDVVVRHGDVEQTGHAGRADQTHDTVEVGRGLGRQLADDGDGDGVRSLLEVVHGGRVAGGHGLHGQRHLAVEQVVEHVEADAGGGQVAVHAVAEDFDAVHVDETAVEVAERDDEGAHVGKRVHGEGLLVELDLVGGGGEAANRTLTQPVVSPLNQLAGTSPFL